MDTSFGTSKFAISTFFDLNSTAAATDYKGLETEEDPDFFIINCTNLTVFRVDFLHSRYIDNRFVTMNIFLIQFFF